MPKKEETTHISQLKLDPKNARKRTERSSYQIRASLEQFGGMRSIVIDEQNTVRAGNGTVEEAGQVGIEKVRIVDAEGDEIIAVRRHGLTEEQWKTYAIADNRTAELSEWSTEVLAELQNDVDLSQFWRDDELDRLLGQTVDDVNYDELWEGMPEFNQNDADAPYSIRVNFYSLEDVEEFSRAIGQTVTEKTKFINYPAIKKENLKACMVRDES